ncbi:MAG: hypothetical protein QOF77_1669 [Solirubrobacteraceae bacterium]|jgi:hypothetical protein|nr:hypothetical protein [Solirubrobacteraceae bacterium]
MTLDFHRLRAGELLALPGGLLLAVSMFLPWYRFASGNLDAFSAFTVVDFLIAPAAVAAPALTWVTLTRTSPALPVAMAVWTGLLGLIASLAIALRLVFAPAGSSGTCAGVWLGLAGALLVALAGWLAINDERPARGVPVKLPAP